MNYTGGGGAGGWEPGSNGGEKSTGGGRRGGGRRDIQRGRELGEMGKISQHWHNISQQEKHTGAETAKEGGGNWGGQEAGSSDPPVPPPLYRFFKTVHGGSGMEEEVLVKIKRQGASHVKEAGMLITKLELNP